MPLKVLIAGCPKEERERIDGLVRAVIGKRAASEPWVVSLVRVGTRWSATLDGPDPRLKAVTFAAPEEGLRDAILDTLHKAGLGPAGAATAPAQAPRGPQRERRDRYACGVCRQVFQVIYESGEADPQEMVPVACPHCWQLNRVGVGKGAAEGREYRAEKA